MSEQAQSLPTVQYRKGERLLTTKEAAEWCNFKPRFLEARRARGGGPKYLRISSRAVRYLYIFGTLVTVAVLSLFSGHQSATAQPITNSRLPIPSSASVLTLTGLNFNLTNYMPGDSADRLTTLFKCDIQPASARKRFRRALVRWMQLCVARLVR